MKKTTTRLKKVATKKHSASQTSTSLDLVTAALIISLLLNLFVVCLWITLQVTSQYDTELIQFFIHRG